MYVSRLSTPPPSPSLPPPDRELVLAQARDARDRGRGALPETYALPEDWGIWSVWERLDRLIQAADSGEHPTTEDIEAQARKVHRTVDARDDRVSQLLTPEERESEGPWIAQLLWARDAMRRASEIGRIEWIATSLAQDLAIGGEPEVPSRERERSAHIVTMIRRDRDRLSHVDTAILGKMSEPAMRERIHVDEMLRKYEAEVREFRERDRRRQSDWSRDPSLYRLARWCEEMLERSEETRADLDDVIDHCDAREVDRSRSIVAPPIGDSSVLCETGRENACRELADIVLGALRTDLGSLSREEREDAIRELNEQLATFGRSAWHDIQAAIESMDAPPMEWEDVASQFEDEISMEADSLMSSYLEQSSATEILQAANVDAKEVIGDIDDDALFAEARDRGLIPEEPSSLSASEGDQ